MKNVIMSAAIFMLVCCGEAEATIEFCKQPAEMITEKTDAVIAERMDAQVEEERLGMFSKLADKWRKK